MAQWPPKPVLVKWLKDGVTLVAMAERLDVSRQAVEQHLNRLSLGPSERLMIRAKQKQDLIRQVLVALHSGESLTSALKAAGLTKPALFSYCKSLSLPLDAALEAQQSIYRGKFDGMRFGAWTILDGTYQGGKADCICECGRKSRLPLDNLIRGMSKSCGCKKTELRLAALSTAQPQ